jgi:hypothetical protein
MSACSGLVVDALVHCHVAVIQWYKSLKMNQPLMQGYAKRSEGYFDKRPDLFHSRLTTLTTLNGADYFLYPSLPRGQRLNFQIINGIVSK